MTKIKDHFIENRWYYLLWAVFSAVFCVLVFPQCSADYLPYDTAYQYGLNSHSWGDMLRLIPADYSPPLYAVLLKLFTMPFDGSLLAMRVFSLLPIIGMFFLALFPVRRAFGSVTAVVFAGMVLISTNNVYFLTEARPAVLAYFFVTAGAVYTYLAYYHDSKGAYICITVFAVLGMYTHNIAMLSALGFYLVAGAFCLFTKQYAKLKKFLISGGISAVLYIPWLFVVLHQFGNVLDNYWSSMRSLPWIFTRVMWDAFGDNSFNRMQTVIIVLFSLAAIVCVFRIAKKVIEADREKQAEKLISDNAQMLLCVLFCCLLLAVPVLIQVLFSLLVYPLITARFLYIVSGIALLLISAALAKCRQRILPCLIGIAVTVNFFVCRYNVYSKVEAADMHAMVDDIQLRGEVVFLHSNEWTLGILSYYFPDAEHYVYDGTYTVLTTFDVFGTRITDIGKLSNIAAHSDRFYIVSGQDSKYDKTIDEALDELGGFSYTEIGRYSEPYSHISDWIISEVTLVAEE